MRPVVLRARAMPVMTRAQAADAAARQQHETLGGLIAQLRQLERDVGSEAYVVYYTSRVGEAKGDERRITKESDWRQKRGETKRRKHAF